MNKAKSGGRRKCKSVALDKCEETANKTNLEEKIEGLSLTNTCLNGMVNGVTEQSKIKSKRGKKTTGEDGKKSISEYSVEEEKKKANLLIGKTEGRVPDVFVTLSQNLKLESFDKVIKNSCDLQTSASTSSVYSENTGNQHVEEKASVSDSKPPLKRRTKAKKCMEVSKSEVESICTKNDVGIKQEDLPSFDIISYWKAKFQKREEQQHSVGLSIDEKSIEQEVKNDTIKQPKVLVISNNKLEENVMGNAENDELGIEEPKIEYVQYISEMQMPMIMRIIQKDLSEPYSIYTYRYFIHNWPNLCFLVSDSFI